MFSKPKGSAGGVYFFRSMVAAWLGWGAWSAAWPLVGSWGGSAQCPSLGVRVIDVHDSTAPTPIGSAAAYSGTTAEHLAVVHYATNRFTGSVLFAGVNTDQCVLCSLQDANFLGYGCIMVEDCCATTSPSFCTEATVWNVKKCYGFVTQSTDVIAACAAAKIA